MTSLFRTLRFRLVLLNLLVFGSIQAVLAIALLYAAERFVRHDFDSRLTEDASSLAAVIDLVPASDPTQRPTATMPARFNPFRFLDFYQIRDDQGQMVTQSSTLGSST